MATIPWKKSGPRIYIVPSWHGLFLAVGTAVLFFLGSLRGAPTLTSLSFFLIVFFMIGMFQTNENLKAIVVENISADPGPAGGHVALRLSLLNRSAEEKHQLHLSWRFAGQKYETTIPQIAARARERVSIAIPVGERGEFPVPQVRLHTKFPMGLFFAWTFGKVDQTLIVYPKPDGKLPLPPPRVGAGKTQVATGEDFSGHRLYVRGDSQKHIDWKVSARGLPLMVKQFESGEGGVRKLQWDYAYLGSLEERLSQLSRWVQSCNHLGEPYSIEMPGVSIAAGSGEEHYRLTLRALARYSKNAPA